MKVTTPSLSGKGWVSDPDTLIELMFLQAWCADPDQSNLYAGKVTSFKGLFGKHGHDSNEMATNLAEALNRYMSKFFGNVEVDVSIEDEKESHYQLKIFISGSKEGKVYDWATSIKRSSDGSFKQIFKEEQL